MEEIDKNLQPNELQVIVPDRLRGGVYANITNANISSSEVTLNFIYSNSNDTPSGTVVSRVIVSRQHAMEIAKLLRNLVNTANEVNP